LKEIFGSRVELIQGSSVDTLPTLSGAYDIIHIDGGHTDPIVKNDCDHAIRLSSKGTILIMDDYDFPNIRRIWNEYCSKYKLLKHSSHIFETKRQDIRMVPVVN
jgi:predicted O-methyltransferase YrrM